LWMFRNISVLQGGGGLLAPRPTPKLEGHLSSAVHDCLFNLFAATHLIEGRSSNHNLRTRHAVVTETHHTVLIIIIIIISFQQFNLFLV